MACARPRVAAVQLGGIRPNQHISGATSSELVGEQAEEKEVEEVGDEEIVEVQDEEEEDCRQPAIARAPVTPTKSEWDARMLLHAEYRSWCPFCVQGKAHCNQHLKETADEDNIGVTISMD